MSIASIDDFAATFAQGGYVVHLRSFGEFSPVLIAESPYALVAAFESNSVADLPEAIWEVQASLTNLAEDVPSPRRWDLYVFAHLLSPLDKAADRQQVEELNSDTRYARKIIRSLIRNKPSSLKAALRPLLPFATIKEVQWEEPLDLMEKELLRQGLDSDLAATAVRAYKMTGGVSLP